jgi:signal recognition particle receptor subunit beta
MVFFNYSTMQMAAKVVYYGPGLCGKTTNLHYIYGHTTNDSRGEMVSLETETDRTLFFDLLPLDVGSIAGFNTRIQLYTVPGQVFYNTTRKLVLKGVDGVVFVVDSQRAMLQANLDSFHNLEENLNEMGLSADSLPLVLQYNKRDLADICTIEELNQAINRQGWPWFEASAVSGQGVFETLKGISKHTLLALKKRLGRSGAEAPTRLSAAAAGSAGQPPRPAPGAPAATLAAGGSGTPAGGPSPGGPAAKAVSEQGLAAVSASAASPAPEAPPPAPAPAGSAAASGAERAGAAGTADPADIKGAEATPQAAIPVAVAAAVATAAGAGGAPSHGDDEWPPATPPLAAATADGGFLPAIPATPVTAATGRPPATAAASSRSTGKSSTGKSRPVDVLGELEKLRREAMQPAAAAAARPPQAAQQLPASPLAGRRGAAPAAKAAAGNGRAELSRNIELTLKRSEFARARRFLLSFQVEDEQHHVVDAVRDLQVEIKDTADIEKLLLRFNIALHAKE